MTNYGASDPLECVMKQYSVCQESTDAGGPANLSSPIAKALTRAGVHPYKAPVLMA